ncbi:hypothetical protein GK047_19620 [Paenibacillus sp. SYP-B3998]|uniref:Uncharacterized protein n=1 Tax=Paenibacillus sp. SYP-B3998 TaxID=2678564 RepID=A0A6G4A166_9BACL|nr:hypothetical protein [Paenibacillus sp. SYP-B3998]NEW08213.1 hypothetical protein [Paenibacillus sp. SYP-B3998]
MDHMEELYKGIGERCPYKLAKHQGVKLTYLDDLGDICGLYKQTTSDSFHIYVNANVDIEMQENVVHLLIEHHNTELRGTERCLLKKDLHMLRRIGEEIRKTDTLIADIFLQGFLGIRRNKQR